MFKILRAWFAGKQTTDPQEVKNPKFEVFQDASGEHRWRLRSANGNIIATSGESFRRIAGAYRGCTATQRILREGELLPIVEVIK